MQKYKLLFKLFYKSSSSVIKIVFISLFIILSFSFFSLMTIQSLNKSYKNYIFKNYTGNFGTVFFILKGDSVNNEAFLFKLAKLPYKHTIFSKSLVELTFKEKKEKIKKRVSLITWQKDIAVNTVFKHLLFNNFSIINKNYSINIKCKVLDTGFLNREPIIFLNKQVLKQLNIKRKFNEISFEIPISKTRINNFRKKLSQIAQNNNIEYQIKDVLSENKIILQNLNKIKMFELYIYVITLILSLIIILFILNIFINIKKRSMFIMRIFGLSANDISLFFGVIGTFVIFITIILGWIFFNIFSFYFKILPLLDVSLWLYSIMLLIIFVFLYVFFRLKLKELK